MNRPSFYAEAVFDPSCLFFLNCVKSFILSILTNFGRTRACQTLLYEEVIFLLKIIHLVSTEHYSSFWIPFLSGWGNGAGILGGTFLCWLRLACILLGWRPFRLLFCWSKLLSILSRLPHVTIDHLSLIVVDPIPLWPLSPQIFDLFHRIVRLSKVLQIFI